MSGKSTTWAQEVRHVGLNRYLVVRGPGRRVVEDRAAALGAQWDAEWERRCDAERRRSAPPGRGRAADRRFVESRDVASIIDGGANLAAMDWRDFEHLVRQVFESEFASEDGEVRVTQASRDGGVDAIVFNPDPIKGGKIIIQAKRYTNTVEVGAVRDLYGTVVDEGASKGILVTTSQFGPDARKFALGKPLTLIDGGNLLFLLEKMGVKARIDLKEAKFLLANAR
jgi:restriction system protein